MNDGTETFHTGGRGLTHDEGRIGDWMQSWTGRRVYIADPNPDDIDILDIAFAGSNASRYGGHCRFYSVDEHSYLVSLIVPERHAMSALFHDATESYIADLIRPLKRTLGRGNQYFVLEDGLYMKAIAPKFGLPPELPEEVKNADVAILGLEKKVLLPRSDEWELPFPVPTNIQIRCLEPREARRAWLERYCDLTGVPRMSIFERLIELELEDNAAFLAQFDAPQ